MLTISSDIRNNALHDLTLIKMTFSRFVGTENVLIRYSFRHTKLILLRIEQVLRVFLTKHYSLN